MQYTDEQISRLRNTKLVNDRLNPIVQYWIDKDPEEIPANIHLLFEHVLNNKPSQQKVHFIDENIYYVDYKATIHRYIVNDDRFYNGFHVVDNFTALPKKSRILDK